MTRRGWRWGAVAGMLGLVLWFAMRGTPEAPPPDADGQGASRRSGVGPGLQALFQSAPGASGDAVLRIRGHVRGAQGAVEGARVLASAVVAGESLSALPCGEDAAESALDCYRAAGLSRFVTQRQGEAPVLARATSEADGSFSLEGLEAGHYALWVESSEGTGMLRDVAAGDEGVELVLGEGVWVSGLVDDEERAPVAGALVTAIFTAHSRYFETVTDGLGRFRLGPLPRGEYVLLVSKEGLLPARERFTGYAREMERKFHLLRPRRVSGRVLFAGAPAAGVRVGTWSFTEATEFEVYTDAAGRFSLEGLVPSNGYELIATRDGLWASTRVDFAMQEEPPRFLEERTDLTLELSPIVEVKGVVRDGAGRPIDHAVVEVWEKAGADFRAVSSGWTDAEGRYVVGPAKPGALRLDVHRTGYGGGPSESREVFLPAGTSTVDFVLPVETPELEEEVEPEDPGETRTSLVLAGEVVDELGMPVPGVDVGLWSESSKGRSTRFDSARTDANGLFSLEAPTGGRYRVVAELALDDVTHTAAKVVEVDREREGTSVQLRFERGQVLSGVVVDTRGQPLEGARVEVRSALRWTPKIRRGPEAGVETGLDGRFTFQSVSGGQLELDVTRSGYTGSCADETGGRRALPVKPGDRELRVVLVREAFVHGRLVQKDGTPITFFTAGGLRWNNNEGRFSVPIHCTGTLELELSFQDVVHRSHRMLRSVAVREEEDVDLGTLVFGSQG